MTNAVNIATELAMRPHLCTVVLGGRRPQSYELVGPMATHLSSVWFDILVLGVDGLTGEAGPPACMRARPRSAR